MITTLTNRIQYNCGGGVVDFAFPYEFFNTGDLVVVYTNLLGVDAVLTETTHYAVTGQSENGRYESGGTVTTVATYLTGEKITIYRSVPITQLIDYTAAGQFSAETHETGLDKNIVILQQLMDLLTRSLKIPATDPVTLDMEMPGKADRLGKYLYFDVVTGEPVMVDSLDLTLVTVSAFMQTVLAAADANKGLALLAPSKNVTADYVILDNDGFRVFFVVTGAGDLTLTLPTLVDNLNRDMIFVFITDGGGNIIIDGEGAETIFGATTQIMYNAGEVMRIKGMPTEWKILHKSPIFSTIDPTTEGQTGDIWYKYIP